MHELDYAKDLAKEAANNHSKFECFAWFDKPEENSSDWAIIYTSNRDSGLLDKANEKAINEALEPFSNGDDPDIKFEEHSHWAVGWVSGFAIRVYKNGEVTPAFIEYSKLKIALSNYPVLDEADYSEMEYEAALDAIKYETPELISDIENVESKIFGWLWDNEQETLENVDDQGPSPSKATICRALEGLKIGYECPGCDTIIQVGTPTESHRNKCEYVREWDKDRNENI